MSIESEGSDLNTVQKSTKKYADTVFRTLFNNKKAAIELCNAILGTNYPENTEIKLCTISPDSLLSRYNDVAICIRSQLIVICEHQSTLNINVPLRILPYISDTIYTQIIDFDSLYGNKLIKIPTPKFYVLYNGKKKLKEDVLRLSDSFIVPSTEFTLEITVKIIDINYANHNIVLEKSENLNGYAYLVFEIRKNLKKFASRDKAIKQAINTCIEKGILAEFLKNNYEGVVKMLNYEYDEEAERRALIKEGKEEGIKKGRIEGIKEGIKEGRIEVAKNLLLLNFPLDKIVVATGLTYEEIEELRIIN